MGGRVFSERGLLTPRMPPHVYRQMVQHCHSTLGGLFRFVATPIEGPAKEDFGDVDALVAGLLRPDAADDRSPRDPWEDIIRALGAGDHIIKQHDGSAHLALPWPDDDGAGAGDKGDGAAGSASGTFVQVDVRICSSERLLRWIAFRHAHGDIWNILGSAIRALGLTADEAGLWLRIPEIEEFDRKKSKVFLTDDPHEVLQFLGLPDDQSQWDRPFASYEDLFLYAASCRFFFVSPAPASVGTDDRDKEQQKLPQDLDAHGHVPTGHFHGATRQTLKSNDRRRMNMRPVFRAWIDDFIPRCRAAGLYPPPPAASGTAGKTREELRADVRDQCFACFPAAAADYAARLAAWNHDRHRLALVEAVKTCVPTDECERLPGYDGPGGCGRTVVIAALRKIVLEEEGGEDLFADGVVPRPSPRRTLEGLWFVEDATAFVREHWRSLAPIAWAANRRRMAEIARVKELKRKTNAGAEKALPAPTSQPGDARVRLRESQSKEQPIGASADGSPASIVTQGDSCS